MQEANDKTQLKKKKSTSNVETNPAFFYPAYGFAGIASAFTFFRKAYEEEEAKKKAIVDDKEIPMHLISKK